MAEPLAYHLTWESWYVDSVRRVPCHDCAADPAREVMVGNYTVPSSGVDYEIAFREHLLGVHKVVRLEAWADAWRIFAEHSSLFTRLQRLAAANGHDPNGPTLEDVVALLKEYGAADVTARKNPHNPKDQP